VLCVRPLIRCYGAKYCTPWHTHRTCHCNGAALYSCTLAAVMTILCAVLAVSEETDDDRSRIHCELWSIRCFQSEEPEGPRFVLPPGAAPSAGHTQPYPAMGWQGLVAFAPVVWSPWISHNECPGPCPPLALPRCSYMHGHCGSVQWLRTYAVCVVWFLGLAFLILVSLFGGCSVVCCSRRQRHWSLHKLNWYSCAVPVGVFWLRYTWIEVEQCLCR
jgi:hypothetical protein